MNYKAPFYAISLALYQTLAKSGGAEWFDSSVPIFEIEDYFKKQDEFAYGIIGAVKADCTPNDDMALWEVTTDLEVYSNYKGRKVIANHLETLLNYLSSQEGWDALQEVLKANGFAIWRISVGSMQVNLPMYSDRGIWQSGACSVTLAVSQLEQ